MHLIYKGGHITTLSLKQGFKAFPQQSTRFTTYGSIFRLPCCYGLTSPSYLSTTMPLRLRMPSCILFHLLSWKHFKEPTSVLRLCSLVSLVGESASVLMVGLAVAPSSLPVPSGTRCKDSYYLNTLVRIKQNLKLF